MTQIKRTYPQPDSDQPNIGPRERALAVFKYLMNIEPEQAVVHPRFDVIVHAFEQAMRHATRHYHAELTATADSQGHVQGLEELPPMPPSRIPLLTEFTEHQLRILPFRPKEPFVSDGL